MSAGSRLAPLFHWLANRVDDSQPQDVLQSFLAHRLAGCSPETIAASPELQRAAALASGLGLFTGAAPPLPQVELSGLTMPELRAWIGALPKGQVGSLQGILPGSPARLHDLLLADLELERPALLHNLEYLLRHVEVKRRASLALDPPAAAPQVHLERCAASILFSQAARQLADLRFLNAALKLNDWEFQAHRRLAPGPQLWRYLLALAQAEQLLAEVQ